jgi:hypothetical protein
MAEQISVDDFLSSQQNENGFANLKFTLEQVSEDPDVVRITPYIPLLGCRCELSFKLPKVVIAFVEPTGETFPCCGKILQVVRLKLKPDATLPVPVLLEGLTEMAAAPQAKPTLTSIGPELAQLATIPLSLQPQTFGSDTQEELKKLFRSFDTTSTSVPSNTDAFAEQAFFANPWKQYLCRAGCFAAANSALAACAGMGPAGIPCAAAASYAYVRCLKSC